MTQPEIRHGMPTLRRTRVRLDGATCAACGRPICRGDLARIEKGKLLHPKGAVCVPAWEVP